MKDFIRIFIISTIYIISVFPVIFAESERNPIFLYGETLEYDVSWMGIRAGTIKMNIELNGLHNGFDTFKGVVIGETTPSFATLFVVKDVISSIFSMDDFRTYFFSKNIHEGKYRKIKETIYDHDQELGVMKKKTFPITEGSKDPVSSIYYLRDVPLELGKVINFKANADEKEIPVQVHVDKKESIETPLGDLMAFVLTPIPTWEGRVFEKGQSTVKLWLSDDVLRVPLKIQIKVKIGSLSAVLVARRGPGWGFDRKDKE